MKLNKGFTLIELLVVIAIIGILTYIVIGSTSASRATSRNDARRADLGVLQLSLAQYYDSFREYPLALSDLTDSDSKFMTSIPVDPQTGLEYTYSRLSGNKNYCLGATLEGDTVPADTATSCVGQGGATYWVTR